VNASTFAHEMGHAANGYFSAKNQPFNTFENGIFKAEIASTTNEVLFLESQLKLQQGEARQEILVQYIDLIVGTIFEQMKASEFEKLIHEAQADGKDLDGEFLVETWKNLNVKYYGKDYEASDLDGYEWTNIDHLYWDFYMYKYATGLASGYNIAMNLIEDPEKIRGKYMAFLKSGNSLDTLNELDGMKIKLSDGAALESCYKRLAELMDELESTLE
jgi:oligoendopeptidase F